MKIEIKYYPSSKTIASVSSSSLSGLDILAISKVRKLGSEATRGALAAISTAPPQV
jgi:hypothetical protein